MTRAARLEDRIAGAMGEPAASLAPMSTGTAGDRLFRARLGDGRDAVIKASMGGDHLGLEGRMLRLLAARSALPVPEVLASEPDLLIMSHIEAGGGLNPDGEIDAADAIAALHAITEGQYGLDFDTVIGGLPQANGPMNDWPAFFAERRLIAMARQGLDAGRLETSMMARIESLSENLGRWIGEPGPPSLLHGDLWGGNVLARSGRLAGFIDPAVYLGDAEIELAFTTLFHTFSDAFYDRYAEHRPIRPGFFEERCALYNLYPLLVHVRLFGGSYLAQVDRTLTRFSF